MNENTMTEFITLNATKKLSEEEQSRRHRLLVDIDNIYDLLLTEVLEKVWEIMKPYSDEYWGEE